MLVAVVLVNVLLISMETTQVHGAANEAQMVQACVKVGCKGALPGAIAAHPNDCTAYCQCQFPHVSVSYCPEGFHYKKNIGKFACIDPEDSKCVAKPL